MESKNMIYIIFSEKRITEGIKRGRVVLVTEGETDQRIKNALNALQISLEVIKVSGFDETVVKIGEFIIKNPGSDFVVDLNDSEPHLAVAVLTAFFLTEIKAYIVVGNEQLTTADISPTKISLTKDHINIIKTIDGGFTSITSIARRTGIPQTSVWRRIKELKKENIVDDSNHLTYKGRLLLKIFS